MSGTVSGDLLGNSCETLALLLVFFGCWCAVCVSPLVPWSFVVALTACHLAMSFGEYLLLQLHGAVHKVDVTSVARMGATTSEEACYQRCSMN